MLPGHSFSCRDVAKSSTEDAHAVHTLQLVQNMEREQCDRYSYKAFCAMPRVFDAFAEGLESKKSIPAHHVRYLAANPVSLAATI